MAGVLRRIGASLLAFVTGGFCGGMIAQLLAVSTNATEEYILVFVVTAAIAAIITVPFFIAQFFAEPRRAIDRVAIGSAGAFAVVLIALVGWTLSVPPAQRAMGSDFKIVAGLVLPNLTAIGAHWLVLRAMQPRTSAQFGRRQA